MPKFKVTLNCYSTIADWEEEIVEAENEDEAADEAYSRVRLYYDEVEVDEVEQLDEDEEDE